VKLAIKKGTTSKRVMVFIQDSASTTGAGKTGLTSASVTCYYWREDEGNVGATAVTLVAGTRGTWSSGGFVEKDATNMPGFYELGIPDAALATGADWVGMQIKGTGIAPLPIEIQLTDNTTKDVYDRIGAPAGASLAADVAAVEAQTDDIGVAGAGLTALGDARLGNLDAAVSSRATPAQVNAEVLDVLGTDTFGEPASVPPATSSLIDKIKWLFTLARNKMTQTSTVQTLRNDADSGNIATASVSDDATTFTRGEWT